MNWYKQIKFANTSYGLWISPNGETTAVPNMAHMFVATEILHRIDRDYHNDPVLGFPKGDLEKRGYVALANDSGVTTISFHSAPTPKQIQVIEQFIDQAKNKRVYINGGGVQGMVTTTDDIVGLLTGRTKKMPLQIPEDYY